MSFDLKLNAINKVSFLMLVTALILVSCNKSSDDITVGNKVGNLAPAFSLQNVNGDTVSNSDFNGKYVLVEFCASWCGYCKAEFPELNEIYSDYKDKGFEIISLSIDENREPWLNMIEEHNIEYVTVNEPLGFNSPVVKDYGVLSIPRMFLLNEKGEIILSTTKASAVREAISKRL